jgi:hypothetical protein
MMTTFNLYESDSPPFAAIKSTSEASWGKYPAACGGVFIDEVKSLVKTRKYSQHTV